MRNLDVLKLTAGTTGFNEMKHNALVKIVEHILNAHPKLWDDGIVDEIIISNIGYRQ